MTCPNNESQPPTHGHGNGLELSPSQRGVLTGGIARLLELTDGMEFQPLQHEEYPLPLTGVVYKRPIDAGQLRSQIGARMHEDPIAVLEDVLVLLELYESNRSDIAEHLAGGLKFIGQVFAVKRRNGWASLIGDCDRQDIEAGVNARWRFNFFNGPRRETNVYVLLNMIARYAFVYGRMPFGDAHAMGHFVEDHAPGVLVCCPAMTDLELTLSLAAMKMGVPAVVPQDYPFALGRTIRYARIEQIPEAVAGFPNIRKLLDIPGVAALPEYCRPEYQEEQFTPARTWGNTPESFYIVRKGSVQTDEIIAAGSPQGPIGIIVTLDAEPMDGFDRKYIEGTIIHKLSMVQGLAVRYNGETLAIDLADGVDSDPARIGEVLTAAVRKDFPRVRGVHVEIIFDAARLGELAGGIRQDKQDRQAEIDGACEERIENFYGCVACSPFAPDHMCVVTPQRKPQCGQPYERIKAGALYAFDDMTSVHHSVMHRDISSYIVIDKGRCIDAQRGEWSGVNEAVAKYTQGRTRRVQLHAIDEAPHTGCSCFRIILFLIDEQERGIGIMDAGYEAAAPDGRRWKDLHYSLAGKQAPGLAGAAPNYLTSPKFLQAHGGWDAVAWVSPKIAAIMGDALPSHVTVGD